MAKHNAANERIKHEYFRYLKEARGRDGTTIDAVAKSLARFEQSTGAKDFKRFHPEQAVAFKRRLADAQSVRTGEKLSKATLLSTMRDLKAFFFWLAHHPGFKQTIEYASADYFSLSEKDTTIARASREKRVPTLEQVERVLDVMPATSLIDRRDRALVALTAITGARANALASFQLGHVDIDDDFIEQDARTVRTKFAKTFRTYFMPVSARALEIFTDWVREMREMQLAGPADALFPATAMGLGPDGGFEPVGLHRYGWATTQPIRDIFRKGFAAAGLPYCNPHTFRDMLVHHAMKLGLSPEAMKAWSQNLGHADVMTTFTSYGAVPALRQGELIRAAGARPTQGPKAEQIAALETMLAAFKSGGGFSLPETVQSR